MNFKSPQFVLVALLGAWLALAAPPLWKQFSRTLQTRALLEGRSAEERTAFLDTPGFRVAEEIAHAVPESECVVVLAYAGPAAIDYYQSRFSYYLYPRRVRVFADSSAATDACGYLAVFRDSDQNLANEPFAGHWDQNEIDQRARSLVRAAAGDFVDVFRDP